MDEISRDLVKTKEGIRQKMINLDLKYPHIQLEEQQHENAEKKCCNSEKQF